MSNCFTTTHKKATMTAVYAKAKNDPTINVNRMLGYWCMFADSAEKPSTFLFGS
jgi:hypothetical protein